MNHELVPQPPQRDLARAGFDQLPAAIVRAGEPSIWRFLEFFTAHIRNLDVARLTVHRSSQHLYAQVIAPGNESFV